MKRAEIYAFLSRIFKDVVDKKLIKELKKNEDFLELLLMDDKKWFTCKDEKELEKDLNIDFSTLFLIHNPPIESSILDESNEVQVGLQNPVMQFYVKYAYDLNLNATSLQTPDHIAIEFAFMQNLIEQDEKEAQREFLKEHLLVWVIPYLLGIKTMASTPFYRSICDFTCEFLANESEILYRSINV